jgi:hypothetical protein
MYMLSACLMLVTFIAITVSLERLQAAQAADVKNSAAGIAALFFYFAYSPTYNIGNNALTYSKSKPQYSYDPSNHIPAYLVELWPYAQRSRGIGVQQIFGKLAGFFSTNVNSIALNAIKWRYLAIYCGWIFFEFCIVFMLYPETSGRTLEELTFRKPRFCFYICQNTNMLPSQSLRTTSSTRRQLLLSRSRFTLGTRPRALNRRVTLPRLSTESSCRLAMRVSERDIGRDKGYHLQSFGNAFLPTYGSDSFTGYAHQAV